MAGGWWLVAAGLREAFNPRHQSDLGTNEAGASSERTMPIFQADMYYRGYIMNTNSPSIVKLGRSVLDDAQAFEYGHDCPFYSYPMGEGKGGSSQVKNEFPSSLSEDAHGV